jgi:hypothetical protein
LARLVENEHLPGARFVESFRIVPRQRRTQPPGFALGFVEVAQQHAFRIGKVFRRDDLEPKPAHFTPRRRRSVDTENASRTKRRRNPARVS